MGVFESFRVALDMLRLHKLRAFLTMLGVIIGVMSVSLIVEVSGGFKHFLTDEIKKLGSDTIIVFFDPGRNEKEGMGSIDRLTNDDIQYIADRATKIDIVGRYPSGSSSRFTARSRFFTPTLFSRSRPCSSFCFC